MNWLRDLWCNVVHGGGHIKRDDQGRINWQCATCGRWSDPVPLEEENELIGRDIDAARKAEGEKR